MTTATLNGSRITSARVYVPAWGAWYAEVDVDGEVSLSGQSTIVLADLTLRGCVLSGGAFQGRSKFRVVAGAGGWGREVKALGYANDAGVKVATVIGDAASLVGETVGPIDSSGRVGPAFARPNDAASRVLELLSPERWYIDNAGITQIGRRPVVPFTGAAQHGPLDLAARTVTVAAESISALMPGAVVEGLEAVDVLHELTPDGGLRTTIWGAQGEATSRQLAMWQKLFDKLDPFRAFRCSYEYRVVTIEGKRLNLQPVRVSTGMPSLKRVPMWPGVAGAFATVALGSRVVVSFLDGSPGRPYVSAFEDADGDGFLPLGLEIANGHSGVARVGDEITITPVQWTAAAPSNGSGPVSIAAPMKATITTGSAIVRCG